MTDVLIYGGGAVGLGIGSCLLAARARVDIIAREDTVASLRAHGLLRRGLFGDFHAGAETFECHASLDECHTGPYDFVLVCTKSFDSAAAAADLAAHRDKLGADAKIVLLQNGWGNAEVFSGHFGPERIYSGRVITGFQRHRPHEVEITVHADAIHIGTLFAGDVAAIEPLCRAIGRGGIPCESTGDVGRDLWAKMLYNCALNPLGAVLRVPYGALAEQETTRQLMDQIVAEVFAVMGAAGYTTHWPTARDFLDVFYARLVPDTAEHESSMLQDIAAGKRTEIGALNGAVMDLADRHGIDVPHNRAVYNLVRFLESQEV
ncbi:MAG: 2-dehydropantoate 2-reductase [Sedimentisphaerales bacterium]|nr:2-dehydropantoate 2-reductase [Sedimentisphaerales bacterium]